MYRIGIVAHTSRATEAKNLASTVKADFISIDNGVMGCDQNHETVQHHLAGMPSTWSVILEDDAVPVESFRNQLTEALPLAPAPIISLYLGKLRPPWAQPGIINATAAAEHTDAHWIVSSHLFHAVGYAIKTSLLPSLLNFPGLLPVDQHISHWAQAHGHLIANAYPSLVDHRDTPTVIVMHPDGQPRIPGRVAWKTAPHTTWTSKSVTVRTAP